MATFDVAAALKAGYSERDIAEFLGKQNNFDATAAMQAGYNPSDIIAKLAGTKPETTFGGQTKEFFKGIAPGAIGAVESAATGASALLPEEMEKSVRESVKSVASAAKKPFEASAGYEDSTGRKFGEALGSTAPFFALGPLGAAGRVGMGALGMGMGAGEARVRAEQEGATGGQRAGATALGALVGTTEMLPVFKFIDNLANPVKQGIMASVKRAAATGGAEGAQEAASQIAQNLIAKGIYKPDQEIIEGTGEAAGYGGATGALIQAITDMALGRRAKGAKTTEPSQGQPSDLEQKREEAKLRRAQEQFDATQGKDARAGEKLLAAEDADLAKAAAADSKARGEALAAQEAELRAKREADLQAAFPTDYQDVMDGANAFAELYKEKQSLENVRKTQPVKDRLAQIQARMVEITDADTRVASAVARLQQDQEKLAKAAGFPAKKSATAMEKAPAQVEMREAMLAPDETLPQQLDLRGKPLEAAPDEAAPTLGDIAEGVPLTTENLQTLGLGPSRTEMRNAGQMNLFGRQPKQAATPTQADTGLQEAVTTEEQPVTEPTLVEKPAALTPETAPTVVTPDVLGALGVGRTATIRKADHGIMGKDITDPAQAGEVKSILEAYKEGRSAPIQQKIDAYLARPEFQAAAPAAPTTTGETIARPSKQKGRGTRVSAPVEADTGIATPTVGESERAGVVPTEPDAGKPAERKGEPAAPVNMFAQLVTPQAVSSNPEIAAQKAAEKATEESAVPEHKKPWGGATLWGQDEASQTRKSEAVERVEGQSFDSLQAEIANDNSLLGAALRRAIASGKVIISDKHPSGERFGGFFDGNRVFLYSDGIPAGQAMAVALHEVGVHMGLQKLLGKKQYDAIIERIKSIAQGKVATPDRMLAQAAIDRIPKEDIARGADVANDELLAYFIEETAKAEAAGTLPKFGPLRAAWTQMKNAIVSAVNRVLGTNLGVNDLTAQQIAALAKGALFVESYTKAVEFVENGTGYMSRFSAPGKLSDDVVTTLDNMIAETAQPLQPSMAKMVGNMAEGLLDTPTREQMVARARQKTVDKYATITQKTRGAYTKGIRSSFGDIDPEVYLRQADAAGNLAAEFLRKGDIYIDPETTLLRVRESDASMFKMLQEVGHYQEDNGIGNEDTAMEQVSKFMENHRLFSMLERNEDLEQSAKILEAQGRTKEADAERNAKFKLHHDVAHIRRLEAEFQKNPRLKRISSLMNDTKNNVIDLMVSTGRITKERGEILKENSAYVPFDRVFDDDVIYNIVRGKGVAVYKNIPSMKGGSYTRPVHNVVDAYSKRLSSMVQDAAKNYAASKTLQSMADLEFATKLDSVKDAKVPALVITVYENGEPTYYEVQDKFDFEAFKQQPEILTSTMKLLSGTSKIFRATITAMPEFAVAQVVKDATYVYFNSGVERPVVAAMKTLYNLPRVAFGEMTGKKTPVQKMAESFGIFGDYDFNILEPTKELEYEAGLKKRRFGIAGSIFHKLEQFTKASDMAARLAVFEETLLETGGVKRPDGMIEGGDMLLAQTRARELINFSRQGTSQTARILSRTVPFFNAYAQGMDRTYRAMTGLDGSSAEGREAAKNMFWKRVLMMSTLATVYALAMSDDDDYRNASDELRDNNWLFPHGGRIPIPREYGFLFKAIPERVVGYLDRYGTPEEQQVSALLGSTLKAGAAAITSPAPVPAYLKPVVEHITNHSFFTGRELVPASQKALAPGEQHVTGTSETAKLIGQKAGISPIVIDNYLKGFSGIAGGNLLMLGDALLNPTRPDRPLYQMPFAKIFLYDTVGGRDKTEFYELRERVAQANTTLKALEEKDPARAGEFFNNNAGLLMMSTDVNNAFKELNDIRKMRVFIQDASDDILGMSGKERRAMIDELRQYENDAVAHVRMLDKMAADIQKSVAE